MYQENGILKLIDFGLARDDMPSEIYSNSKIGTKCYLAPEMFCPILNNQVPSLANYTVDLWALGVLILYTITLKLPFGKNEADIEKKVTAGIYDETEVPYELRELIHRLLKKNPSERIKYEEIK